MNEDGIIVVSFFDGMSNGQIALNNLGIKIDKYYSSEIDKYPIKVTQNNFKDTIQLGDIVFLRKAITWKDSIFLKYINSEFILSKHKDRMIELRNIDWSAIDLALAGSPCQGFSFAGKRLAFNDPRSKLFFEFIKILNHIKKLNPSVKFLLENVQMKKEYLRIISEFICIFPVNINSNLVSAQNRNRWYWTNIHTKKIGLFNELYTDIKQPKDEGILLKDILQPENEIDERYYLKNIEKYNLEGVEYGGIVSDNYNIKNINKAVCLDAHYYKGIANHQERTGVCVTSIKEVRNEEAKKQRKITGSNDFRSKEIELRTDGKIAALQTGLTKEHTLLIPEATKKGYTEISPGECVDLENIKSKTRKGRKMVEKSNCMVSGAHQFYKYTEDFKLRRLTPIECERLQTVPDNYTFGVSDTQRYKMLGNGWTVKVIEHILSFFNN